MSIQHFILKQYAKFKMKNVPEAQREQVLGFVEKDPKLFKKIGNEIERRTKGGESQTKATIEVMKKYRTEISDLMNK